MNKKLLFASAAAILALGAVFVWQRDRWPLFSLTAEVRVDDVLTLDQPARVVVQTNQDYERTRRLGVSAALGGFALQGEPGELFEEGGKASFRFTFVPRAVVHQEPLTAAFTRQNAVAARAGAPVTVAMPIFYRVNGDSFLEMVSAPGSSVYGSHITLWNDLGSDSELFVVTGHAASSVCRVASAALFGLGFEGDVDSPHRMLGAGVACLDLAGFQQQVMAARDRLLEDYPEMAAELTKGNAVEAATLVMPGDDLKEVGDMLLMGRIKGFAAAINTDFNSTFEVDLAALKPAAEHVETVWLRVQNGEVGVSPEELATIAGLMTNPRWGVAAFAQAGASEFEVAMAVRQGWPMEKREAFDRALGQLVEKASAFDTARENLSDLAQRTGLVRRNESTLVRRSDRESVTEGVAQWARDPAGSKRIELAALASGQEGCVLLPFFDARGQAVEFTVDANILSSSGGTDWRQVLQGTTAAEFSAVSREIHRRFRENVEEVQEQIVETTAEAAGLQGAALRAWLEKEETVRITEFDGKGRPAGTKTERQSHLKTVLSSWRTGYSFHVSEQLFGRLAKSSERMLVSPQFRALSDACLIDSLLRGWNLAFSDEETEKKFEAWSRDARDRVWAQIWRQAAEQNLDPRNLRTEGTVFQIHAVEGKYRIRPVFVGEVAQTDCIRHEKGGLVGYTTPWFERRTVHHAIAGGSNPARSPEDVALETLAEVRASLESTVSVVSAAPADRQFLALRVEGKRFIDEAGPRFQVALCASPEAAVSMLVGQMLNFWPQPPNRVLSRQDREYCKQFLAWHAFTGDEGARWERFGEQLVSGTWPFADDYVRFAVVLKENASEQAESDRKDMLELAALLTAHGTAIDARFMADAAKDPAAALEGGSARYRLTRDAMQLWQKEIVTEALRIVLEFGEADRAFENWDEDELDRRQIEAVLADLRRAPAALRDSLRSEVAALEAITAKEDFDPRDAKEILSAIARRAAASESDLRQSGSALIARLTSLQRRLGRPAGLSAAADGTDSPKRRVLALLGEIERQMRNVPDFGSGEAIRTQLKPLGSLIAAIQNDADFDPIDRQRHRYELKEITEVVAAEAISQIHAQHRAEPSRRNLETLVQLQWAMGQYSSAFDTLKLETGNRVARAHGDSDQVSPEIARYSLLAALFTQHEASLLKACVYSGGEFFGASIFGKRVNDWAKRPETAADVVVKIDWPEGYGVKPEGTGAFGDLYRKAIEGKGDGIPSTQIGDWKVVQAIPASFTDLRVFKVVDADGNLSIMKILPNDPAGRNLREMQATVRMTDYLARNGVPVPRVLGMRPGEGGKVLETADAVVIRETVAPGIELGNVARTQGGLTLHQEQLYVDATLDAALKGRKLSDDLGAKPRVDDFGVMHEKLKERAAEAVESFDAFAATDTYRQKFGGEAAGKGASFHQAFDRYLDHFWNADRPLEEVGFVHDAIFRNYFLEGEKVTVIDVAGDYVGSVGNVIGAMTTQLQPPGKLWTYAEYKERVISMIDRYGQLKGTALTEAQRIEIIQHLPVQPYRMLSSDSGQLMRRLKATLDLPENSSGVDLVEAIGRSENAGTLEAFLNDAEMTDKYQRYMRLLEHGLQLSKEHLPAGATESFTVLNELIEQVRSVQQIGLRVVFEKPFLDRAGLLARK